MILCDNDEHFTAISSCRSFDFTLSFSSYILSVLPSLLLIVISISRTWWILKQPYQIPTLGSSSLKSKLAWTFKMSSWVALASLQLALLVLLEQGDDLSSKPVTLAFGFSFAASIFALVSSHLEHFRTTRPSLVLPFYLFCTILFDAARLRTFITLGTNENFYATFGAALLLRTLCFAVENLEKAWLVKELNPKLDLAPEESASFVSRLFFLWTTPLLLRGSRTQLSTTSLPPISRFFSSPQLYSVGHAAWLHEVSRKSTHPLLWTLLRAFPGAIFVPVVPCAICSVAIVMRPVIIEKAIQFIESYQGGDVGDPVAQGWGLAAGGFLLYSIYGIAYSWGRLGVDQASTMLRGFLIEEIYRKSLRVHVDIAKETGSGKAGSLMALETEKILSRLPNFYEPLAGVIIITIGLYLLYLQIGLSFLATIVGVIALSGATPLLAGKIGPAQGAWSELTDKRQKLTASLLKNIVGVRLSAWTAPLRKRVVGLRTVEVDACTVFWSEVLKIAILTNVNSNMINLVTIGTYAVVSIVNPHAPPLTSSRMFTTIAILAVICQPLFNLGQGWSGIVAAWQSLLRIEKFLLSEEKQNSASTEPSSEDIVLDQASFGRGELTLLKDLTTSIPTGKLTFIIGKVGAGKSCLLQSCIGELDLLSGSLSVPEERTAYASQDPWLRNESIRNAITFASSFDEEWYALVVRAVALDRDLQTLEAGDKSLTSSLSGGQRARVALARAVYSRASRIYLDDPFSALDANTEASVFHALFAPVSGLLSTQTVMLVTNGIHRLPFADKIIMLANGAIVEQGTYKDLLAAEGPTRDLVRDYGTENRKAAAGLDDKGGDVKTEDAKDEAVDDEGSRIGTSLSTYRFYAAATGIWRVSFSFLLAVVAATLPLLINVYQNFWSESVAVNPRQSLRKFFGGYVALELLYCVAYSLAVYYFCCMATPHASRNLHTLLLDGVLRAPLVKLKAAGIPKITNRFSSDMFLIDMDLRNALIVLVIFFVSVVGSSVVVIASAPWVGLVILVLVAFFAGVVRFYTPTSQQIRRLDLGAKSPLYGILADVMDPDGLRTIRAFGCQEFFTTLNTELVERSQKPYYLMAVSQRWLNSTVNFAAAIVNTALIIVAVASRHSTSAGIFAVALVQATGMTQSFNQLLIIWVECEIAAVAVERVREFAGIESEEAPKKDDTDPAALQEVWPQQGGIQFKSVSARYGDEREPILKNLTFNVPAGSRVGIVGRTGSGKSTTLAALFRMITVEEGGAIVVDGKNIDEIGLEVLRNGMTLIPQDPIMLEMSLRDNLDLDGRASDTDLWDALEKCQMREIVEQLPGKLDEVVTSSGRFSRGQSQLLALARALIRGRKILCLDEATSSLDVETDQAIQSVLRTAFGKVTIITVAHRIATIRDYDLVLVMDNGKLAEQGDPDELVLREGGMFRALATGE